MPSYGTSDGITKLSVMKEDQAGKLAFPQQQQQQHSSHKVIQTLSSNGIHRSLESLALPDKFRERAPNEPSSIPAQERAGA